MISISLPACRPKRMPVCAATSVSTARRGPRRPNAPRRPAADTRAERTNGRLMKRSLFHHWTGCAVLFAAVIALHDPASAAETWRGLVVAPEHRCSPYDRRDYSYSQSVEPRIVAALGGRVYGPYTGRTFASRRRDRHRAHRRSLRGPRQRPVRGRRIDAPPVRLGPAQPHPGGPEGEPLRKVRQMRQGRRRLAAAPDSPTASSKCAASTASRSTAARPAPLNGFSRAASPRRWCSTTMAARRCPPVRPIRESPPAAAARSPVGTTIATDASPARKRGATASRRCGAAIFGLHTVTCGVIGNASVPLQVRDHVQTVLAPTNSKAGSYRMRTHNLFISHSWTYGDAYSKLVDLLTNRAYFRYKNYSVPEDNSIHNAGTDHQLYEAIKRQITPCGVVLILAGVYSTYSKWINKEIRICKTEFEVPKPIIAIEPWASKKTSKLVKNNADIIVKWNANSIVGAIRDLA